MHVSIILPSLNEEKGIAKVLNEIPDKELKRLGMNYEIIVVDGNSTDNTQNIIKENNCKLVMSKKGYGKQYKAGFKKASGEIIATLDSDGQYNPADILKMIHILKKGDFDFISGDRLTNIKKGIMKSHFYIANKYLNFWIKLLFGLKLNDSQSGMWVFRKDILDKIKLRSNGFPFSEEFKIEAFKKVNSIEVPIDYRKRKGNRKLRTLIDGHLNFFYLFIKRWLDYY